MITERDETLRIQSTSVRGESEVWIFDGNFYKKMTENELDAYGTLSKYKEQLEVEAKIAVPTYYGEVSIQELQSLRNLYYDANRPVSHDLHKISTLSAISYKDIEEKFGDKLDYSTADFDNIFTSLGNLRRIIEKVSLRFPEDYESSTTDLMMKSKKVIDSQINIAGDYPLQTIDKSQRFLSGNSQKIAHRDLNWSNMGISRTDNGLNWNLEVADWGSFGYAYAGYDEGRLLTRLSLNPDLQNIYLSRLAIYLDSNMGSEEIKRFMVSFWRTSVVRSHREIFLAISGRYKNPVDFKYGNIDIDRTKRNMFYSDFIESHKTLIKKGVNNLEILLSC